MIISWIPDPSGRFRRRPFFPLDELDRHCERIVQQNNAELYGQPFPGLRTDALIRLVNKYADLHLYENLSRYGDGVEAVTSFATGAKPTVRIAAESYYDRARNNHLRFVIAHEFGHTRFHAAAWRRRWIREGDILRCSANDMLTLETGYDWWEWQANFLGGSLLMPKSSVDWAIAAYLSGKDLRSIPKDSSDARNITQRGGELFEVSDRAAFRRLCQLGYLID